MPSRPEVPNSQANTKYVDLRVRAVMQMLTQRRHTKIKISHLAREVGVTHRHLSRLFSRESHVPPSQLLRQARFEKAAEMLRTTRLSVKEVMTAAGVNDKSHFTKDFKRIYGISPIRYRQQHCKFVT